MTSRRVRFFAAAALAAALAAFPALPASHAEDKPPREWVQELLPQLRSEDDALRKRAEDRLFGMGEQGRLEMERLARSKDAGESTVALRLLQSDRWAAKPRPDDDQPPRGSGTDDTTELRAEIERGFAEARKRIEEALRRIHRTPIELSEIEWPEIEVPEIRWSEIEFPRIALRSLPSGSVSISGVASRDGRTIEWTRDASGKTTVSVKEGGGEPRTYEAESVEAFRAAHPQIAELLDDVLPSWTGGPTLRIIGGFPEIDINQDPSTHAPRLPAPVPVLGIGFDAPSELLCHHLGIESGVVVTRVLRDSRAAELGLRPKDVLLSLSGRPVSSSASIREALTELGGADLTAEVIRAGKRMTVRAFK
jgi:hypothetical protein